MATENDRPSVLCVDDDHDVADVVQACLVDEGYLVSCLYSDDDDAVARAVGRLEPDVVLLDSSSGTDYGQSWEIAAALHARGRRVPAVMFTAHQAALGEAELGKSDRAHEADFAAIVPKPFELDELLRAVASAAGRSVPFDRSKTAEGQRRKALVAALDAQGATDIRPSKLREWALFRDKQGSLAQLYWWQQRGVYMVGRYDVGGVMVMIGQFTDRDAAIEQALP